MVPPLTLVTFEYMPRALSPGGLMNFFDMILSRRKRQSERVYRCASVRQFKWRTSEQHVRVLSPLLLRGPAVARSFRASSEGFSKLPLPDRQPQGTQLR